MNTKVLLGVGVGLALMLSFMSYLNSGPGPQGPSGDSGVLGSAAGPEDTFQDRALNGVFMRTMGSAIQQGTTTGFVLATPNATTTPDLLCHVELASSTVIVQYSISDSANGYSSSTVITTGSIAAGAKATFGFKATSTAATQGDVLQIAPNRYLLLSFQGGIGPLGAPEGTDGAPSPNFAPTGYCNATLNSFGSY